jgi:hypothetical protein
MCARARALPNELPRRVDPFGSLDLDPAGAYVDGGIEIRPLWADGQRKMRWANAGRRLDGLISCLSLA